MKSEKHKFALDFRLMLPALIILAGGICLLNYKKISFNESYQQKTILEKKETLGSFYKNKNDYDLAFFNALGVEKKNILAGITSHHFLAKDLIAKFFSGIENNDVQNVIVIGPDHYGKINDDQIYAITTYLSWETPYGQLDPNREIMEKILANKAVIEDNSIFMNEHSIYILVPFIKKTFPEAKIIPLVIHNNYDFEKFENLGIDIRKLVGEGAIVIISSDFSHNVSAQEAGKNDKASIDNLKNLNTEKIKNINCDCKACMAFLNGFLSTNKKQFYLVENKNSNDFGSQDRTVTSYVSGYFLMP